MTTVLVLNGPICRLVAASQTYTASRPTTIVALIERKAGSGTESVVHRATMKPSCLVGACGSDAGDPVVLNAGALRTHRRATRRVCR